MMRRSGLNIEMTFSVCQVLDQVQMYRDEHAQEVEEAKQGYRKKVAEELRSAAVRIDNGEIVNIQKIIDALPQPQDRLSVYDSMLDMLMNTTDKDIRLTGDEYRKLMQDEWDWREHALESNSTYSAIAMRKRNTQ